MKSPLKPLTLGIDVAASADVVWELLVAVEDWPLWGPSVRRAEVDGGHPRIGPGARGTVHTVLGPAVRFEVTDWQDAGADRHWSWRVAGVPATRHTVRSLGQGCRVELSAPWWAPGYAPVLWWGLRRIRALAEARPPAHGTTD